MQYNIFKVKYQNPIFPQLTNTPS